MSSIQDKTQFDPRPRRSATAATHGSALADAVSWSELPDEDVAYPALEAFAPAMDFRADISVFRGPMDLLLYLVRKHELDVTNIPIADITQQYIAHLEVLEQLDVDSVGDFVEVASLLIEIKSRMVLPQVDEHEDAPAIDDPRDELVQRLLEYKKFKDAASILEESGHQWQQRYARVAHDLQPQAIDPATQPIHEVELWDLVSAMGRVMRECQQSSLPSIVYDDTPMQVHMQRIHERLIQEGRVSFISMFAPGMHKSRLIGIFLAVLELARHYGVVVEQEDLHADVWLTPGEEFVPTLEVSEVFIDQPLEAAVPLKPR